MSVGVMKGGDKHWVGSGTTNVKFRNLDSWNYKKSVSFPMILFFVYYETVNQVLNRRLIYECRCDERV
jgi:hypothetical protein